MIELLDTSDHLRIFSQQDWYCKDIEYLKTLQEKQPEETEVEFKEPKDTFINTVAKFLE